MCTIQSIFRTNEQMLRRTIWQFMEIENIYKRNLIS